MRTLVTYTSDATGRPVTKDLGDMDVLPEARASDQVLAEGRPRQVNGRQFHIMSERDSGNWDNQYDKFGIADGEKFCVVKLIG